MNYNRKEQLPAMNRQIKELSGVYRSALSRLGLSENEFWIWYALLIMEEAYSQQDLCDEWSLSKQTVNTIITGMVKKGYVELRVVPGTEKSSASQKRAEAMANKSSYRLPKQSSGPSRKSLCVKDGFAAPY